MADDDVVNPYAPWVEHTAVDVRKWLDPDWREQFEAEWAAAIEDAKTSYDLAAVTELVEQWWPKAQICACPGARAEIDQAHADYLAGTLETVPYDLDGDD